MKNPPSISRTVDVVRKHFSIEDIDYSSDENESSKSDYRGHHCHTSSKRKHRYLQKYSRHQRSLSFNSRSSSSNSSSSASSSRSPHRRSCTKIQVKVKLEVIDNEEVKKLHQKIVESEMLVNCLTECLNTLEVSTNPSRQQYTTTYTLTPAPPLYRAPNSTLSPTLTSHSCFICGKMQGSTLDHPLGVCSCLEVANLIKEGLVKFNPISGQLA